VGRVEDGWVWWRLLRQLGGRAKVPPATRRLLKQALHDAAFVGACRARGHACEILRRAQTYEAGKPATRIAKRAAGKVDKESDEHSSPAPVSDRGKMVSLESIQRLTKNTYQLGECMGSLLREQEDFDFGGLDGIRKAYSLAFSKHSDRIDKALADRSLDALALVRNLIIHRAGVANVKYEERANGLSVPQLKSGEMLAITGELVGGLTGPVMRQSVELIRAVDSWLTAHAR
jgi:hypothetical protein